ncbi:MAG: aldehyde ferredoxin oxidoreductase family protein [Elusimicrobiota bacterium]|nr:aldehyde ferredoxin oxidoreductase family protein [Elusimicrobiota bacterium]
MFKGGYAEQLLYIDLTKGKIEKEPLPWNLVEKYIGGAGLASKILYDMIKPKIDPLSSENVLMFSVGPLCGTLFPQASRFVVAAKNPLTGGWGEAHAAGFWGPELKLAGYDGIIFTGKAKRPVYLYIENDLVELRPAKHLWGMKTFEAMDKVREEIGNPQVECVTIGPAGENLCRQACIITHNGRVAARSGLGTVMGSKNLKLVAVRGTKGLEVAKPDEYLDAVKVWYDKVISHPYTEGRVKYGTSELIDLMNSIGRLPTRNLQQGVFEEADKINAEAYHSKYFLPPRADYACIQRCGRFVCVPSGPYKNLGKGPEYECLDALGARCGNSNLESIIYLHHLCDEYGIDTIEFSGTVSWAMECYEKKILTTDDTDGLKLNWGNYDAMIELAHRIAHRRGKFGDLLAEGSYRAAKEIRRGSQKYVMHSKGQEIASQEPRAQKSMGLAAAVAARGADHLYAFPVLDEGTVFDKEIRQWYGEKFLPEIGIRLSPKNKGYMIFHNENYSVVIESLGVCKYGTMVPPALYYEDIIRAMDVTIGWQIQELELKKIGERIVNLNRLFNVREGMTRKDDSLPERLTKEPAPVGLPKGQVVELDEMLDEYYKYRGWDKKTGIPKKEKLKELGLI